MLKLTRLCELHYSDSEATLVVKKVKRSCVVNTNLRTLKRAATPEDITPVTLLHKENSFDEIRCLIFQFDLLLFNLLLKVDPGPSLPRYIQDVF